MNLAAHWFFGLVSEYPGRGKMPRLHYFPPMCLSNGNQFIPIPEKRPSSFLGIPAPRIGPSTSLHGRLSQIRSDVYRKEQQ